MLKAVAVQCSRLIIKHRNNAAVWVWVWVGLRPIDLIISKGCSMAPNPSESALLASLQTGLFHWKTFSTVANTQLEQALHDAEG